jgi:hypothetical protein
MSTGEIANPVGRVNVQTFDPMITNINITDLNGAGMIICNPDAEHSVQIAPQQDGAFVIVVNKYGSENSLDVLYGLDDGVNVLPGQAVMIASASGVWSLVQNVLFIPG